MTTRLPETALSLLVLLSVGSLVSSADKNKDPSAPEKGVTFSHVYKIDIPGSSGCKLEPLPPQDEAGVQTGTAIKGDNDITFRHNIRLQTPKCDCEESESFKSLLYRVNGLEEEVNYLKTQCSQGCCGRAGGVDSSCGGHGTYQQETCSCVCDPGWEGPDCSLSSCPDDCNDNGRCVDGKCVCLQGYTGHDCSQALCPDNCNDKGRCEDGKCVCFPHFTGETCGVQRCPNDCIGNGVCVDGRCVCEQGFHGEDCSLVLEPQGLDLVQTTDDSLLVEWDSVSGAERYLLKYHSKHHKNDLKQVQALDTENSYLITGLTPGATYIVEVRAVVGGIESEAVAIEATTDISALDSIRILGQTEDSIQVEWENPQTELDHFRLKHVDPSGQLEELKVQKSQEAQTKHTIVGLNPGTEYQISVQAIKGSTEGRATTVIGATNIDAPPKLVTTEVTEDTVTVSWDQVQSEIQGYMLSYSTAGGSSADIPVGRDRTYYTLMGLKPGVVHTVYIWAYHGDRVSRKSSAEAETDIDAPKELKATDVSTESATLTWTRPLADIDGYVLTYRDEESAMEAIEQQISAGESSLVLSSLQTGKSYIVTIVAYRGSKKSTVVKTIFRTVGVLVPFPMDCVQILKNGVKKSGVYTIFINNDRSKPAEVFCDMDTDGGGWLVLQRRTTGRLDFMKRWRQYIAGFGDMTDEFWIGLDKIYELTNTPTRYELRFDLGLGSERVYAVYDNFRIASVKQKFKLTIGNYSGTAGDAMTYHQGRPWTTVDNDNDIALGNCALTHRGAWWYKNCHLANPNGKWGDNRHSVGVNWEPWKGHLTSLDFTEMKIRPAGATSSRKRRAPMAKENRNLSHQRK